MRSSYAAWKLGEVERVGLLHVRHDQRARAVGLLHGRSRARGSRARGARRSACRRRRRSSRSSPAPCCSARSTAKPMRCVNETLPPRARARWLLRIWRLISSSLAGTVRTDVAVGTSRLASMLLDDARRRAAQRLGASRRRAPSAPCRCRCRPWARRPARCAARAAAAGGRRGRRARRRRRWHARRAGW